MTTRKWLAVSAVAGVVVYYCEWLDLIYPGTCNQSLGFTIARMYALPMLLSGLLGFYCFKRPLVCWLSFMLPSWIVRLVQLIISAAGGGNLWPLMVAVDAGHLLLTGIIVAGVARLRRGHILPEKQSGVN